MFIVRMAKETDIAAIMQMAQLSEGTLHSLSMNKDVMLHKITRSMESVARDIKKPGKELYFFVLEDTVSKRIAGCCAINACVGLNEPFYIYRITKHQHMSHELNYRRTLKLLELNTDFDGATELCSLYILPEFRQQNTGRLLSLSRLLFISCFPTRFSTRIFADIRGFCRVNSQPPFWQHVIKRFIPMNFAEADKLSGLEQRQFIADLMPTFPLCIDLLPLAARSVIGLAHPAAQPARKLLEQEGLHYQDYVNIFDAGPTLSAFTSDIRTLSHSQQVIVKKAQHPVPLENQTPYLLANNRLDFRVIAAPAVVSESHIILSKEAENALQVEPDDIIMCKKNVCQINL